MRLSIILAGFFAVLLPAPGATCDRACLKASLEMDPTFLPLRNSLAWNYAQAGSPERAIEEQGRVVHASGQNMFYLGILGYFHAMSGGRAEAEAIRRELEAMKSRRYVSPYVLALIDAAFGEIDRSFERLEEAFRTQDWQLVLLRVDARLDVLRADPRFDDLLRRAGFPDASAVK